MRVALLADYLEEGWPSMDLVAEMLAVHLPAMLPRAATLRLLRPKMHRRFSAQRAGRGWMLDRLANRLHDYPCYLRKRADHFDLFHLADHSYSQLVHELPVGRTIVTCHDLDTFRCLWEPAGGGRGPLFRAMTRRILTGLQKAAHICCDSEATRDELLERKLACGEKLSVVRLGLRPSFLDASAAALPQAKVEKLLGEPSLYGAATVDLLHVGSTITRKRIDILLRIFARVRQEIEPRARLLRVGGPFSPAQLDEAKRLGLPTESILTLPFLSPAELAAVYRHAALMLLPSDAEGFGFPIIEALACGTPVLASDLLVLREVGGSVAEYAPVADLDAWTSRVKLLLTERYATPASWAERQRRCRQQGARFSWQETARQTVEVYHRVLADARVRQRVGD